jgi:hypothetical protein
MIDTTSLRARHNKLEPLTISRQRKEKERDSTVHRHREREKHTHTHTEVQEQQQNAGILPKLQDLEKLLQL